MSIYQEYFDLALDMARRAGPLVKEAFNLPKNLTFKGDVDIVTETDEAVETLITNSILERYPTHQIIAEEAVSKGLLKEELTDEPTWIIDPIDGTTNFVHKFPFSCISIGFAMNKEIVVGVVYNPMIDDLFTAIKGEGAFRNGNRISVSTNDNLMHCLVSTGFPYARDDNTLDVTFSITRRVLKCVRDIRRSGSAVLDMCYVAAGVFDIYYERGVRAWDVAAGYLIVKEAGGDVRNYQGDENYDICGKEVVVSSPVLMPKIISLIKGDM